MTPTTRVPGLYYSYEKAGLTLERQPIPWNAEAVIVEALVRMAQPTPEALADFSLHLPGGPSIAPEMTRPGEPNQTRLFFRLAVPKETMPAEIRWRGQSKGQINLPLLTEEVFLANLTVTAPTLYVRIKDEAHACHSYVTTQAKEFIASMLLSSPTSLAPIVDFELAANLVDGDELISRRVIRLESQQLEGKQALIVAPFAKPRGWVREWSIVWTLGETVRASQSIRAFRPSEFLNSLRISTTRLYLESDGGVLPLARVAPTTLDGVVRLGPVFLVSSNIAGMAAQAEFQVRVVDRNRRLLMELPHVSALVTGGPTVVAPGTVARDDAIGAFELWCGTRRLGEVAVMPVPTAAFTAEGGIAAGDVDFAWSAEAENQLQQKLGQLLGGL